MQHVCSFPGCGKKAHSRGYCIGHYRQWREKEQLRPLQLQFHGLTELQRFELRYRKREDGCWIWTGSLTRGYGRFRDVQTGHPVLAHRRSWTLYTGEDPGPRYVLHKCDNPRCVNPEHLFLGTQADNVADMHSKGRDRKRPLYGEAHGQAKATEKIVLAIRSSAETVGQLVKRFGLARSTIEDIRERRTWKHVA